MGNVANQQWLEQRAQDMRESIAAIRKLQGELGYLQIGWRPSDGGWSIGQVFEHLILTDQPYITEFPRLIALGKRSSEPWKPSLMGGFITRAVEPQAPRKIKARSGFQPGPQPRAEVIGDYLRLREQLLAFVPQFKGVDLNRTRMKSPVMALIRYNLGDALMILTRHTQRHLQQVARLRANPAFPASERV